MLLNLAVQSGVQVSFNSRVISISPPLNPTPDSPSSSLSYDDRRPSITLATGDVYQADVVIGADGATSIMRDIVDEDPLGELAPSPFSKMVYYTGKIPVAVMRSDSRLNDLVQLRSVIWMGNRRQAMCMYSILSILSHRILLTCLSSLVGYPVVSSLIISLGEYTHDIDGFTRLTCSAE